jgi:hypothetical protein
VKDLYFAPYDPGWREVLFSLLDRYWQTDRERVTLTLDLIRKETGDRALALELASAWFQHVIALTPGVLPVLYPDGTPVTGENGEPIYREVAPT